MGSSLAAEFVRGWGRNDRLGVKGFFVISSVVASWLISGADSVCGSAGAACVTGVALRSAFANAASGAGAQRFKRAVQQENVSRLRDHHALPGKLLLDSHCAAGGANAHGAGIVEADQQIQFGVADGNGAGFYLRGVNREQGLLQDASVNGAGCRERSSARRRLSVPKDARVRRW